ncbi:MAG: ATP-binding cassette domain-containing protein [Fibrobacteraceae bacterium]|nr:ATP-binding cassette domain-containing protein [Fibrobacteraceae bacterium]
MNESFNIFSPVKEKTFTIGRKEENDLCFKDMLVSRHHAVIEYVAGKFDAKGFWVLKSLTQNSVTFLNKEIALEAKLSDEDIISIGPHQLRVTLKDDHLTLLVVDQKENGQSVALNRDWTTVPLSEDGFDFATSKARWVNGGAEIQFPSKVVDQRGRSCSKICLKEGEIARLPWREFALENGAVLSRKAPLGFNVNVYNLEVFARKKQLLKDINFDLKAGEILAIIGRSGQGKSSLLKLFAGEYSCSKDSVVTIGGLNYKDKRIREKIAILEQDPPLRQDLTVEETLLHSAYVTMEKKDARQRLEKFCELFGLSERKRHKIKTLSGGEMRRTALASSLMGSPGLILLDEPLSGLDPYNSKILCTHLKQLSFLGHTIILTTHSYEALHIANKVLVIHQGEQAFFGTPQGAYQYFNTKDPEIILSGLTDETATQWRATGARTGLPSNQYNYLFFPKIHRNSLFAHYTLIALKQWSRDKGKISALVFQPIVIGFLFSQIFSAKSSLWTIAFALILCANWYALSQSIREIVQEKNILRGELRKGQGVLPVLSSKLLLATLASLVQILATYAILSTRLTLSPPLTHISLVFLLCVLPAVGIGLLVSSLSKNAGQANAFLPLLIIPQVALAGALVPLDQMQPIGNALSTLIWSRYNQSSLLNLFLQNPDSPSNTIWALALASTFYIITAIILYGFKKAK